MQLKEPTFQMGLYQHHKKTMSPNTNLSMVMFQFLRGPVAVSTLVKISNG